MRPLRLYLRELVVEGAKDEEFGVGMLSIRRSFVRFVENEMAFEEAVQMKRPDDVVKPPALVLDANLKVEVERSRTWILDAIAIYPCLCLSPLTPEWGTVTVTLNIAPSVVSGAGKETEIGIVPSEHTVKANYSVVIYSWVRAMPIIEETMSKAFGEAFRRAAETLAGKRETILAEALHPRAKTRVAAAVEEPAPPESILAALAASSDESVAAFKEPEPKQEPGPEQPPESVKIPGRLSGEIMPPRPGPGPANVIVLKDTGDSGVVVERGVTAGEPASVSPVLSYLQALDGLDVALFAGAAWVSSRATDSFGDRYTIASGGATSKGVKLSFYSPPRKTGFFIYPTAGWMYQQIKISGFRQDIPSVSIPEAEEIKAIASDPDTGLTVDPGDPNVNNIRMWSGFIGQRAGFDLVIGTDKARFFFTPQAGTNMVELRRIYTKIGYNEELAYRWAFLQSAEMDSVFGVWFPSLHFSIQASGTLEWYNSFKYPRPMEFAGRVEYNTDKKKFERKLTYVESAGLWKLDFRLSTSLVF